MTDTINLVKIINKLPFILLCAYLAGISLNYLDPSLAQVHSLIMYAFIAFSAVKIVIGGKLYVDGYVIMYLIFSVLSLFTCYYAPASSLSSIYKLIVSLVICYCAVSVLENAKQMEIALFVFSAATFLLMLGLLLMGKVDLDNAERFGTELTGNSNVFALIYMFGACFSAYFIAYRRGSLRAASLIFFLMQMFALVISGGRKYPVIALVVLWMLLLLRTDSNNRRHFLRYTVLGIIAMLAIIWAFNEVDFLYNNIGYRFKTLLSSEVSMDTSAQTRLNMIQYGIEKWLERPLTGYGLDSFKVLAGFGYYSHNNYVELLYNMGIFGFVVYYGYMLWIVVRLLKHKTKNDLKWVLLATCVALFLYDYGAVSYYFVLNQLLLAFCNRFLTLDGKEQLLKIDSKESSCDVGDLQETI